MASVNRSCFVKEERGADTKIQPVPFPLAIKRDILIRVLMVRKGTNKRHGEFKIYIYGDTNR